MQGAERDASVLHRLAMRRHLVTRKSSAEAWSALCRPSVVRLMRWAWSRPLLNASRMTRL